MSDSWSAGALPVSGKARQSLESFVNAARSHAQVEGILLYGSALWKPEPADFDFVMLLAKPDEYLHFYGIHPAGKWRCEVEYVTPPFLDEYLTHPHWHASNWELDLGAKYVHGRIVLDRAGRLVAFRERITGPQALAVRRYLFVHHLGQAVSRLEKLNRTGPDEPQFSGLLADFSGAVDRAGYHARLVYPERAYPLEGWPPEEPEGAGPGLPAGPKIRPARLEKLERLGVANLGLAELFRECQTGQDALAKLPLYHLVDYTGLGRVLARLRPELRLPDEVYFSLFNS